MQNRLVMHIRPARAGVRIVDEGFQAEPVAGIHRRQRGEAAHAQHRVGAEFPQQSPCSGPIEPQVFHKNGSIRSDSVGGFATAGTVSNRRCVYFARGLGIDLLFGNQQHHLDARARAAPPPRQCRETSGRRCHHRR